MVLATVLEGVAAWVGYRTTAEVSRDKRAIDPTGPKRGTALLVYHAGLSDFPDRIAAAFARGLASQGWKVELVTAAAKRR